MKLKKIEKIIKPSRPHFVGDGFRVHNFIPSQLSMERMDPFIMMDYNSKFEFQGAAQPKGVGVHPHRGFETVTIAYQGKIEHADSAGGGGIIEEGDVQWMTAASGVLHKEFHEKNWSKKGGVFQMVQLWVNLPSQYKMSAPKYQAIKNQQIPKYISEGLEIEIIAGSYEGIKGAASTFSSIYLYNVKMKKDSEASLVFPASYNTMLLLVEGSILINNSEIVNTDEFVLMGNDGENIQIKSTEDACVLVLSGEPLGEPIAAHGPFVMNTQEELYQAFDDYQQGKFGYLI